MKHLYVTLLLLTLSVTAFAEKLTGKAGETIWYELDTEECVLTIGGTGAMYDYEDCKETPWYSFVKEPHGKNVAIVFEEGITHIGARAFQKCGFTDVKGLPSTLLSIGDHAFEEGGYGTFVFPAGLQSFGKNAFYYNQVWYYETLSPVPQKLEFYTFTYFVQLLTGHYIYHRPTLRVPEGSLPAYKADKIWAESFKFADDNGQYDAIEEIQETEKQPIRFDMMGRKTNSKKGLVIEKTPSGKVRKVAMK